MNRSLQAALDKLRKMQSGVLPASALSSAQRHSLEQFARTTGSVQMRPNGRGVVFAITQPEVVDKHWRELSPVDLMELDDALPNRARNIATARSSKSREHQHEIHYLLLKAGKGAVTWCDDAGHQLDLRQSTDQLGAAAFAIHENNSWSTGGSLWLVENQAVFDRLDWLPDAPNTSVAYYSGHLRNSLLEWLAAKPRASKIWFFPDYDGVGLINYARVKDCLGEMVQFWLMPEWETHLTHFGNAKLWQDTFREFQSAQARLAQLQPEPDLIKLIQSMQTHGLALEQESIWLEAVDIG